MKLEISQLEYAMWGGQTDPVGVVCITIAGVALGVLWWLLTK